MELKDYRQASRKFRRLSSTMLSSSADDGNIHLIRLKDFMDNNEIISNIVNKRIKTVNYDYEKEKFIDIDGEEYYIELNIPIDEDNHMKAIYDYLIDMTNEKKSLIGISIRFHHKSKSYNDIVRNYLDIVFKPLVNYINDCLAEEMMNIEPKKTEKIINQHIENNYGSNNFAEGNITSNNYVNVGLKEDINSLINNLCDFIKNEEEVNEEDKEDIIDELQVISEQVNSEQPKKRRIEKAYNRVKEMVKNLPEKALKAEALVVGLDKLVKALIKFNELLP